MKSTLTVTVLSDFRNGLVSALELGKYHILLSKLNSLLCVEQCPPTVSPYHQHIVTQLTLVDNYNPYSKANGSVALVFVPSLRFGSKSSFCKTILLDLTDLVPYSIPFVLN